MTRINVVPVAELCDQHLLAEHRELTRIPNCILKGRYSLKGQPFKYTLGTGHVKFFYDKLFWLQNRYQQLMTECVARGFNVKDIFPDVSHLSVHMLKDYRVTDEALKTNRQRIANRLQDMGNSARWTNNKGE